MNLNSMIHNYLTINKLHKIPIKIKEKEQGKQLYSIIEGDPYLTRKQGRSQMLYVSEAIERPFVYVIENKCRKGFCVIDFSIIIEESPPIAYICEKIGVFDACICDYLAAPATTPHKKHLPFIPSIILPFPLFMYLPECLQFCLLFTFSPLFLQLLITFYIYFYTLYIAFLFYGSYIYLLFLKMALWCCNAPCTTHF